MVKASSGPARGLWLVLITGCRGYLRFELLARAVTADWVKPCLDGGEGTPRPSVYVCETPGGLIASTCIRAAAVAFIDK